MKYTNYFKNVFQLYSLMEDKQVILLYKGSFTQQTTKSVLSMTEQNMEAIGEINRIKRRVFYIMMECLQNITRHYENTNIELENDTEAIFIVGKDKDNKYFIITGNPITQENKQSLADNLNFINSLNKEELKQYHKNRMQKAKLSERGGAGLGFIDIARRTNQKLDFAFENIDDNLLFFYLKVKIV